jgi:hypothetical protein
VKRIKAIYPQKRGIKEGQLRVKIGSRREI